jgi:hypothetical protein
MPLSMVYLGLGFNNILNFKFVKEAEIKHGRTAMVALPTITFLEIANPDTLGINQLANTPIEYQLLILGIFGCSEVSQLMNSYEYPSNLNNWFKMKDSHTPGDYSFNPLNISSSTDNELFIGRLAMVGSVGLICQELVTNKNVF